MLVTGTECGMEGDYFMNSCYWKIISMYFVRVFYPNFKQITFDGLKC